MCATFVTYEALSDRRKLMEIIVNRIIVLALLLVTAAPVRAQVFGGSPPADPSIWFGAGVGAFAADGVTDGGTGSTWDFGSGTNLQYRASLEKTIQNQTSVGFTAGYVNIPITYRGTSAASANTCAQCNAHLKLYTLALSLHAGGGLGFHQVLEASAGVNYYRDLRRDSDGTALAPIDGNIDPALNFGYGFGYNFSKSQELFLIQDYGIALHERRGTQNSQSNTLTMRTTRIGYRMGFGARGPLGR